MVSIALKLEDGKSWHAEFAQTTEGKNTLTRALLSEPAMVLKMAPSEMGKFLQADAESLRDKAEPFQFDRGQVGEIHVSVKDDQSVYKLTGDEWKFSDEKSGRADQDKIKAMLIRLHALTAIEYVQDKPHFEESLSFLSRDGKEVFTLQWGDRQMRKYDGVQSAIYLVKSSLSPDVFTVLAADIENLKLNELQLKLSTPARPEEGKTK
jgi:hypothetical protein